MNGVAVQPGKLLLVGRLLRLSLAPTALADPVVGAFLAGGLFSLGPRALILPLASACVYHGAMALNDWADREHDARTRPDRPLPAGAITPRFALALGLSLMTIGPVLAGLTFGPGPGWVLATAAVFAGLYDVVGRGPILGPALLGACRFANVAFGAVAATGATPFAFRLLLAPLGYAAYVMVVGRLGRLEDDPDREPGHAPRPLVLALGCGLTLAAPLGWLAASKPISGGAAWTWLGPLVGLAIAVHAARPLLTRGRSREPFSHSEVEQTVGAALRRLLVFQAAIALGAGSLAGFGIALGVLLGYPLAARLRTVFPPS